MVVTLNESKRLNIDVVSLVGKLERWTCNIIMLPTTTVWLRLIEDVDKPYMSGDRRLAIAIQ